MNNRFYRTSYKAVAVVLSVLVMAWTWISALAGIVMIKNEFYARSEESICHEVYGVILDRYNHRIFYEAIDGNAPNTSENYLYRILDEDGNVIAGTYEDQPIQIRWENEISWDEYLSDEERYLIREYTVIGYLVEQPIGTDAFTVANSVVHLLYTIRYWVFVWIVLGLLAETAMLIYLFCAVGNHPGEELPRTNPLDKIPFDLATIIFYFFVVIQVGILSDVGLLARVILLVIFGVIDYLLLLWYALTLAVRLKLGQLLRSTLLGQCILWQKRVFTGLLKNLPFIWKTVFFVTAVSLLELIVLAVNLHEPEYVIGVWIIEKLILIPLVAYIAISLHKLKKGGERLAEGNLEERLDTAQLIGDFKQFGETLNSIGDGMNKAVEERMKSERFKTELITNVSHDIKTPLTSIINYVDLIKKEEPENQNVCQYLEVLDRQSSRLKKLIEDLVEASKASTGNLPVHAEPCDAGVLLTQLMGEYDERFREKGLEPILHQPEEAVTVWADPRHFWRILDNLMVNILKYAQSGTRVYLDLYAEKESMFIVFRNISRAALNISGEELMERFVRGDASRNAEGSGLGLSIARSLAELQGGSLQIDVDGDLFKVRLQLRRMLDGTKDFLYNKENTPKEEM